MKTYETKQPEANFKNKFNGVYAMIRLLIRYYETHLYNLKGIEH